MRNGSALPIDVPTFAMTDSHLFTVHFEVADAGERDRWAIRAYDDGRLEDMLLGGPDATGVFDADFERQASSFAEAVMTALEDLQAVFPEAMILRVDPEDLVTLSDVAECTGRTHESVRLLALGRRGPGGFPAPAGTLDARTRVWRWHQVVAWFERDLGEEVPAGRNAAFLAAINDLLDLRSVVPRAADSPQAARALASLIPPQLTAAQAG